MIVMGFPGIGKTFLSEKSDWIDLDIHFFLSKNDKHDLYIYKNIIKYLSSIGKKILISYTPDLIHELDCITVFPTKDQKEDYMKRYRDRGSSEYLISWMERDFDMIIDNMMKVEKKIILKKGQYLEDVLEKGKHTILLPTYNGEKYIQRALDSIELLDNVEIIILDDASTDNTPNIIKEWAKDKPNVKIVTNEVNLGVGLTMNRGYDIMCQDPNTYVLKLCDDDYLIEPLSVMIKELTGEDMIYYDLRRNDGRIWHGLSLPGATKWYKKSLIGNTRRNPKRYGGDKDMYEELLKKRKTYKDTRITFYHYDYPRKESLSGQEKEKKK